MTETVSTIVPTYNEAENVERIVDRLLEVMAGTDYGTEILVMDDDSPDGTWEIARETYRGDDRVAVHRRTSDHGLARAVTDGFHRATGAFCAVIDADLQHPPEKLPALVAELDRRADIAVGSRYVPGGGIENWPRSRRIVSKGATALARMGVPAARGLSDPVSGFFAVRRSVVDGIELEPHGYKILLEVLAKGEFDAVREVPYRFAERDRGESNLTLGEYQNFAEHLLGLAFLSHGFGEERTPMRAVRGTEFALVGGIGTLVNTLVFAAGTTAFGLHYLLAGVVAFLVAVNWNFLGNWGLTFDRPRENVPARWAKFHAVSVGGFAIYGGLLTASVEILGLPELAANVLAILGSSAFNFLGTDEFVFREEDTPASDFGAEPNDKPQRTGIK